MINDPRDNNSSRDISKGITNAWLNEEVVWYLYDVGYDCVGPVTAVHIFDCFRTNLKC